MTARTARARAAAILLLLLAFLAGTLALLHTVGGVVAPPPMTDPARFDQWLEERQPAEAAFALLRLAGLGTAWYLLGATLLSAVVRLSRVRVALRVADLITVPAVRRLANAAAGVTVTAATLSTGAGIHGAPNREIDMITLLTEVDHSPFTEAPVTGTETSRGDAAGGGNRRDPASEDAGRGGPSIPTLRRLPDVPDASQPSPSPTAVPTSEHSPSAAPHQPPAPPTAPAPHPPPTDRWEVLPGQHFWSLAEDLLASAWQRAASDDEVDPYWRRLVAANRSILRDPDNPDLLYPGQVITVPPPPPAPPAVKRPGLRGR